MATVSTPNGFSLDNAGRRVVVDPVTRIEGHMRVEVNVDENMEIAAQYGVSGIPRLLVFKGSATPVQSITGLKSEAELSAMLRTVTG